MDLSTLERDPELEANGVMVMWEDAEIIIRGDGYKPYKRFIDKYTVAEARTGQKLSVRALEKSRKAELRGLAKFIWVSNKNLIYQGREVPADDEGLKIKVMERIPEFRDFIVGEMERAENFRQEAIAEDASAVKKVDGVEA